MPGCFGHGTHKLQTSRHEDDDQERGHFPHRQALRRGLQARRRPPAPADRTVAGAGPLSAVAALAENARLRAELEFMTRQRDILKKAMAIMGQDPKSASR